MKNENGVVITALVVQIIVMLILVGTTITSALGDNGIITMTLKAVEAYTVATEEEYDTLRIPKDDLPYHNTPIKQIKAGDYYLTCGKYESLDYPIEDGGVVYILNKNGTFSCTNFQGTSYGIYKVSSRIDNNNLKEWIITFRYSPDYCQREIWIINNNDEFSNVQNIDDTSEYISYTFVNE